MDFRRACLHYGLYPQSKHCSRRHGCRFDTVKAFGNYLLYSFLIHLTSIATIYFTLATTMPSIQGLSVTYDALNEQGSFSEGDILTGKVTLSLLKDTTIESLFVKAKGDAYVCFSKRSGEKTYTYSSHTRFFKLKQFLIPEGSKDTVVPRGIHVYQFRLNIPTGSLPSSFRGSHGQIVYKLEVKLSRSWRMDRTQERELCFVSKSFPNLQSLMLRQTGSTKKEMGLFSRGHANMDVTIDRKAYAPGDTIAIVAKINNSSSSVMTPKFSLIQDEVLRAQGSTKHESHTVNKVAGNCIGSQTQKEVRCTMKIPNDLKPSIQNCDIMSVEYHLKAYLDISFAFDPEVIFQVVIIPRGVASGAQHDIAAGPYPAGAVGGPSNSDFPPPAVSVGPYPPGAFGGPSNSNFPPSAPPMGPYPVSPNSGRHRYPEVQSYSAPPPVYPGNPPVNAGPSGVYPAQPAHMSGGYNNPASLYGSPFSSSSSVLHPPPSAPTFQPPPEIQPTPPPPPFSVSPTAPAYNQLPSAPMVNTDFLSQSDEAPPAYSLLFPSSANDRSDAN